MDVNSGFKHAVAPGMLRFKANDGKNEVEMAAPAALGKDGRTWTHVGVTLDRTRQELRLFANGAQIGETKKTAAVTGSLSNSVDLGIGALLWKPDDTFKGYVSEVRLYARALSAQEIHGLSQASGRR
jgi:hypothetical protein